MADEPEDSEKVHLIVDNAEVFPAAAPAGGTPPDARAEGAPAEHDVVVTHGGGELIWPETCPVTPLGLLGDVYYALDVNDQLRALVYKDLGKAGVRSLFGREQRWLKGYPPWCDWDYERARVKRVKPELVADALVQACSERGVWDVAGRVRGRGGWRGPDGELVLHCGDALVISRLPMSAAELGSAAIGPGELNRVPTGVREFYVYPAGAAVAAPWDEPVPAEGCGPGDELLEALRSWNWVRADLDPRLLLGWVACGMLGGALPWRPLAWILGDRGTGKSTLQEMIKHLFGQGLVKVSDTTAAHIWAKLGQDSLPVMLDEMEAEQDGRRGERVIQLARQAGSGGEIGRGSQDHKAKTFTVHSAFLFSSINMISIQPADSSRMAVLDLMPLQPGAEAPMLSERQLGDMSRQLRRRLVDQWPRFDATLAIYREALAGVGHSARGMDQFGALLAAGDLLLSDYLPKPADAQYWASLLAAGTLAELADDVSEHQMCLNWLLGWIDPFDRQRRTIGSMILEWAGRAQGDQGMPEDLEHRRARAEKLETYGIKCQFGAPCKGEQPLHAVVVANSTGVGPIFKDTKWQALSGGRGVWVNLLRRLEGAHPWQPEWFAGVKSRGTFIPVDTLFGPPARAPLDAGGDDA